MAETTNQANSQTSVEERARKREEDRQKHAESLQGMMDGFIKTASIILVILAGLALIAGVIALFPAFGAALYWALSLIFNSVEHLAAAHFDVPDPIPTLAASSVVGTTAALLLLSIALVLSKKRRTLVLTGIFFGLWLVVMILLALLDMALTAGALKFGAKATSEAWQIAIPPEIKEVGKFVFAAIAALPVIPLAILLQSVTHEKSGQYPTMAAAFGATGLTILKIALTSAAFLFESYFGIVVLMYPPLMAIPAATLNAIAFAMCLGNVEAAAHEQDHRGVREWGGFALAYAILLLLIVYETAYQFGVVLPLEAGQAVGLKFLPNIPFLRAIAEIGYSIAIGLSAVLVAWTFYRKSMRTLEGVPEKKPAKVDDGGWRVGARSALKNLFSGQKQQALPPPTTQMGSEQVGPAPKLEEPEPAKQGHRRSKLRDEPTGAGASASKSVNDDKDAG